MERGRIFAAEGIGTAGLMLGGVGAAVFAGGDIGFVGVSLVFGLSLLALAALLGHVSGCHINPAVTVGLLLARKVPGKLVPTYLTAQAVGAVVGATYPKVGKKLRTIMPRAIILVPGYGAQGGTADDVVPCFNDDGFGAIVNSSRGITFAYQKEPYSKDFGPEQFAEAARAAALDMKDSILDALERANKMPW